MSEHRWIDKVEGPNAKRRGLAILLASVAGSSCVFGAGLTAAGFGALAKFGQSLMPTLDPRAVPGFEWNDEKYPPVPNPPPPVREGESSCGFTPTFRELSPGTPPRIGVIAVGQEVLETAFKQRGTSDFRLGFMYRHAPTEGKCDGAVTWRQGMGPNNVLFGSLIPGAYSAEGNLLAPTMLAAAIAIGADQEGIGKRNLEIAWAMRVGDKTTMLATAGIDISGDVMGDGSAPLSDLHRFPQDLPVLGPPPRFDSRIGS